jgi:hypothetical protein
MSCGFILAGAETDATDLVKRTKEMRNIKRNTRLILPTPKRIDAFALKILKHRSRIIR